MAGIKLHKVGSLFFKNPRIGFTKCSGCVCSVVSTMTLWTGAFQAPLSVGFFRQEYWNGLPFPSPEIFLTGGLNLGLLHCRQILYLLSHQVAGGCGGADEQCVPVRKYRYI